MSVKIAIQTAIVNRIKTIELPVVEYDAEGVPSESGTVANLTPNLPLATNETGSTFEVDSNYGRGFAMLRSSWQFEARLSFDREVLLEPIETSLLANPILVDLQDGDKPVMLILTRSQPDHPPQQQGSGGTHVRFTFEVAFDRN